MEQFRWVQGFHLNGTFTLFGGQLLSWIDEDTNMLCHNSSEPGVSWTTGSYDRASFINPCKAGDRLRFTYQFVHFSARTVTILCKVEATHHSHGRWERVFQGFVTMVRIPNSGDKGLREEFKAAVDQQSPLWKLGEQIKTDRQAVGYL